MSTAAPTASPITRRTSVSRGAAAALMESVGGITNGYCANAQPQRMRLTCAAAATRAARYARRQRATIAPMAAMAVNTWSTIAHEDAVTPCATRGADDEA